jgi:cytochrome c peroxidase
MEGKTMKHARFIAVALVAFSTIGALLVVNAAKGDWCIEDQAVWDKAKLYFEPLPATASIEGGTPSSAVKVELGRELYFDKRLSRNETISCNSCHGLTTFGVDRLPTSPGDAGQHGDRNSPTVLNAALHGAQFWDGRAADVEEQAGMPILNPVEMAIPSEEFLVERLSALPEYVGLFRCAFPHEEQPLTYRNIRLALASFERTLLTPSPFDDYLRGDIGALDEHQREGLDLFLRLGCASCHNGVNVGGASFRKFGLSDDYWVHTRSLKVDEGRVGVTGDEEDRYVFRVSSLRNVAETGPYFHDGSIDTLEDAVRIMVQLQVGAEPDPDDTDCLASFLSSLTGTLDPKVVRGIEEIASR